MNSGSETCSNAQRDAHTQARINARAKTTNADHVKHEFLKRLQKFTKMPIHACIGSELSSVAMRKENGTCIDGELSSVAMRFYRLRHHSSGSL